MERPSRGRFNRRSLTLICTLLLLVSGLPTFALASVGVAEKATSSQDSNPARSWALGIVLAQGSDLAGDGRLDWESVQNVTAVVQLPELNRPDLPVYAVLSVMTQDQSVLQVAAGIYQHGARWLTYADLVTSVGSSSPQYRQILNSSGPAMTSNASVSLSIFRSSPSRWSFRVVNTATGSTIELAFPGQVSPYLKAGDQEVFALESYSWNQTTFEGMGSLSLGALLMDGKTVASGTYAYSDWDPAHNPLFVLGSPETSPPLFISVDYGNAGPIVWRYVGGQGNNAVGLLGLNETILLLVLLCGTVVAMAFVLESGNRPGRSRRSSTAD